jgi:4-amino-4-deoxy-L-arabinose transferase-like glycosyltransferase
MFSAFCWRIPHGKKTTSPLGNVHGSLPLTGATNPDAYQSRRVAPTLLALVVAAVSLYGAAQIAPDEGYDGTAFVEYARIVSEEGRLPTEAETYEYAMPPGYPWLAGALHELTGSWRAGQVVSALAAAGLVLIAWLLARELWPRRPARWAAAAALTAGLPIVVRLGTMFHPEALFAFLAALAALLAVRGERSGWRWPLGAAAGAAVGLAALVRPTAAAVAVALAAAVALRGRRRALAFGAAGLAALAVVAGPWWGYQTARFGNPLESNLERYVLEEGQPLEFYASAPLKDLVVHPYRPAFAGQLWPQFHTDLWSDWFGGQHGYWREPPEAATRVFLSAQSVLGLAFTAVALAGLWLLRRRPVLVALVAVTWVAFVVQLVRFPQEGGDPIKSSYMLFLAPVFALAAVAAGTRLPRPLVTAWGALYALSYAGFLATSW